MPTSRTLLVLAFGVTCLVPASALADDASEGPRIGSTAHLVSRDQGHEEGPAFPCDRECDLPIDEGRYEVVLRDASGHEWLRKVVAPTVGTLHVSEPDREARDAGLALGVAGGAAFVVGAIMLYSVVLSDGSSHTDGPSNALGPIGLGALVTSAIMLPIGWTMFAHNRKPEVEFFPPAWRPRRPAVGELHLGAKPEPGGAAMAIDLTF